LLALPQPAVCYCYRLDSYLACLLRRLAAMQLPHRSNAAAAVFRSAEVTALKWTLYGHSRLLYGRFVRLCIASWETILESLLGCRAHGSFV